jgi:hypothetical protein
MTFNHAIAKVTSVAVLSQAAVRLPSSASAVPIALDEFSLNGSFANAGTGGLNVSGLTGVSASYTVADDFLLADVDATFGAKVLDFSGGTDWVGAYVMEDGSGQAFTNDDVSGNWDEAGAGEYIVTAVFSRSDGSEVCRKT